jgi:hypothetical protein
MVTSPTVRDLPAVVIVTGGPTPELSGGGWTTTEPRLGHGAANHRCPPVRFSDLLAVPRFTEGFASK